MLPKRGRDAADRKRLFEERQQKDGERRAVSVDFGKPRQVFFGKSPLTKELTRGAFGVSTKLTMDQVRDAAITCREYPVKKRLTYCLLPVRMLSRTGLNGLISSGRDVPRATRAASSPA
jgi:hypothetical protein